MAFFVIFKLGVLFKLILAIFFLINLNNISVQHLNEDIWDQCLTPALRNSSDRKKQGPKSEKTKSSKPEPEKPAKPEKLKKPKNGACVAVSGLSKSIKKKQVVHEIFKDSKITNYGLYMETQAGLCTGKCYVEFIDKEARDRAIEGAHAKNFSGHTINVTAISHDEMETKGWFKNRFYNHKWRTF